VQSSAARATPRSAVSHTNSATWAMIRVPEMISVRWVIFNCRGILSWPVCSMSVLLRTCQFSHLQPRSTRIISLIHTETLRRHQTNINDDLPRYSSVVTMDEKASTLCKRKRHNGNHLGSHIVQPAIEELSLSGELNTIIISCLSKPTHDPWEVNRWMHSSGLLFSSGIQIIY
jgi:hypothetical protein